MRGLRWSLIAVAILFALALGAVLVIQSSWFHGLVREKVVAMAEEATGARVEMGDYRFDPSRMEVRVAPFTLHGTEDPSRAPLFQASRLNLRLKIRSLLKRDVDLVEFVLEDPRVHIYVDEQGKTNFPKTNRPPTGDPVDQFFRLAVDRYEIRNGLLVYEDRRIPLNASGENLNVELVYETPGPVYRGTIRSDKLAIQDHKDVSLRLAVLLTPYQVRVESGEIKDKSSWARFSGGVLSFKDPLIDIAYRAEIQKNDFSELPLEAGTIFVQGSGLLRSAEDYDFRGRISGAGLAANIEKQRVAGITMQARYSAKPGIAALSGIRISRSGESLRGDLTLQDNKHLAFSGNVDSVSLATLATFAKQDLPWNGMLSGPVSVKGTLAESSITNLVAAAKISIRPTAGQMPIHGLLDVDWNQRTGQVQLGSSFLNTPETRLNVQGTLGNSMKLGLRTTSTADIQSLIRLFGDKPEFTLPITLDSGGEASFEGQATGALDNPHINGRLSVSNAVYEGTRFDSVQANLDVSKTQVEIRDFNVAQNGTRVNGGATIPLKDWALDEVAPLRGFAAVRNIDVGEFVRANQLKLPAKGRGSGSVQLSGSMQSPQGEARFSIDQAEILGEKFQRVTGRVLYQSARVDRFEANLNLDAARVNLNGTYDHPKGDWKNGTLQAEIKDTRFRITQSEQLKKLRPGLDGAGAVDLRTTVLVRKGEILPQSVEGTASLTGITQGKQPLGSIRVAATTQGRVASIQTTAALRNSTLSGNFQITLDGEYPVSGTLSVPRITMAALNELARPAEDGGTPEPPPFGGFLEGQATVSGSLRKPESLKASIRLSELRIRPRDNQILDTQLDRNDLTVRNDGPLEFTLSSTGVQVKQARFAAKDTAISLAGGISFGAKPAVDVRVDGGADLALLSTFYPDLIATGSSRVNAVLRGTPTDPNVTGRMEIKNGSFFLRDIANGIDQANGVIQFNQNRAVIQQFTGQTGGGTFTLSGFVGYAAEAAVYRLQAEVKQVRIRYPEGVSTIVDGDMVLSGGTARSLLTGNIQLQRTSFTPITDIGSILAESTRPVSTPGTSNPFLQNMQLDIRIRSAPNAVFQSAYTRELEVEADLRLRGSPAKPIVLGNLTTNQGEIEFFGNRYTISRGQISFYNAAVIQPVLDFDVETRIRGVQVFIKVSGPVDKLNTTFRSDPPLQTNEIVALLTVGRAPNPSTGLPTSTTMQRGNVMENSANTLLGGALNAGVSNRLERFFGVSKIKIDPQVTGLEGIGQSRLTIEQSVSRDVVITFTTNLSRAQQQIIAVEWDINRTWSAIMIRDENGAFSIDIRYRKLFR